jgi:hypothetical protein
MGIGEFSRQKAPLQQLISYRNRWRLSLFFHHHFRIRHYEMEKCYDGIYLCHARLGSVVRGCCYDLRDC